jgi:hypothetical protein
VRNSDFSGLPGTLPPAAGLALPSLPPPPPPQFGPAASASQPLRPLPVIFASSSALAPLRTSDASSSFVPVRSRSASSSGAAAASSGDASDASGTGATARNQRTGKSPFGLPLGRALSPTDKLMIAVSRRLRPPMSELEAARMVQRVWKGRAVRKALAGWVKVVDDDGDTFFRNNITGEMQWFLPPMPFTPKPKSAGPAIAAAATSGEVIDASTASSSEVAAAAVDPQHSHDVRLLPGWGKYIDGDDVWFYNAETGESRWSPPLQGP